MIVKKPGGVLRHAVLAYGVEPVVNTPSQFVAYIQRETALYARVV